MIIFRVAQGIAQTTDSDLTMPGHLPLEHRSIIRFQAISVERPDVSATSQPQNQFPLDELHDMDAESNSHGISHESPTGTTDSAGITEKVGPNAS